MNPNLATKLWEQAFDKAAKDGQTKLPSIKVISGIFADLIVKECIKVGHHAFINDHSVVPTFPAEKIKEHFGVEE
jgi:formate-dependent nitrite reductase cytochrome c552 subunit